MIRYLLIFSFIVLWSPSGSAEQTPEGASEEQILRQIRYGEILYRDDIVLEAVQQLNRVRPDHPEGLLARIRLATRLGQAQQAEEALETLAQVAPESTQYQDGLLLVHLSSEAARGEIARARLLAVAGRYEEALQLYDQLLQGRYPTAELAQEYWQLWVNQSGDYAQAIARLQTALQRFGPHPAILKSLVSFYFSVDEPEAALHYLDILADNRHEKSWAAAREYDYLMSLPVSEQARALWAQYLVRYEGEDAQIRRARAELAHQERLLADPVWLDGQRGLALIEADQNPAEALSLLEQASADYPEDVQFIGAMGLAHLRLGDRVQALHYFDKAINTEPYDDRKSRWISLKTATEYWLLLQRASDAADNQRWAEAERLYQQAHRKEPDNIFAITGLAHTFYHQGAESQAWEYYKKAVHIDPHSETAQRAALSYIQRHPSGQALQLIEELPLSARQSSLIQAARVDYQVTRLEEQAEQAFARGQWAQGIDALRQAQALRPEDPWLSYRLAAELREQGQMDEAFAAFDVHYQEQQGQPATQYAYGLLLASDGRWAEAEKALFVIDPAYWDPPMHDLARRVHENQLLDEAQARYAEGDIPAALAVLAREPELISARTLSAQWLLEAGAASQAVEHYQYVLAREGTLEPNDYRGLARAWQASGGDPQQALDWYAQGMIGAQLLSAQAMDKKRDNVAFTRAMRFQEKDDWLASGLRRDAQTLYEQQNPTIKLHNDHWWRNDGTEGVSRLRANTTILQLEYPIKQGRGFIRADHVRMDAGTLKVSENGVYSGEFGTCNEGSGCSKDLKQKTSGTGFAIGWEGERLAFDIGTTPQGFAVKNWTGGVSYRGSLNQLGYKITLSRRPMSNSLLSFAGAKDPRTGKVWGGVMATGAALSLSWDQGEENGVWADLSADKLTGKNVKSNKRVRLMGGYYRRLVNELNEVLSVGVNLMHWQYQKGLGDYGFGQGGYYSPKRYQSVSLPISYAKRTQNWSFLIQASGSFSGAKNHAGRSSSGFGYTLNTVIERRINKHVVLGAGLDLQHSKDYAPSRGMLYLRYTFEPWQGSMPLGPEPMLPYADFK